MSQKAKKKYYKAVTPKLQSALSKDLPQPLVVTYEPNKWVKPNIKGTKLMVWTDKDKAISFMKEFCWCGQVWEVEVKNPQRYGVFFESVFSYNFKNNFLYFINEMLGLRKKKRRYQIYGSPDQQAVFVDEVKLVKQIL